MRLAQFVQLQVQCATAVVVLLLFVIAPPADANATRKLNRTRRQGFSLAQLIDNENRADEHNTNDYNYNQQQNSFSDNYVNNPYQSDYNTGTAGSAATAYNDQSGFIFPTESPPPPPHQQTDTRLDTEEAAPQQPPAVVEEVYIDHNGFFQVRGAFGDENQHKYEQHQQHQHQPNPITTTPRSNKQIKFPHSGKLEYDGMRTLYDGQPVFSD